MQNDLLSDLRDIRGIEPVSWWPLAPGWWILLASILAACIAVLVYRYYKQRKTARWQRDIKSMFTTLRDEQSTKAQATALSELLRRIAIHHHGRNACAGLEGHAWLEWLSQNDPSGFIWTHDGKILIEAPYAPPNEATQHDMEPLIRAAERWVR